MIPLLIYLFVWSTAAGEGAVGGLTRGEFVGLLPGADPGQPAHLLHQQLDRGRRHPLRPDEPAAAAPAVAGVRRPGLRGGGQGGLHDLCPARWRRSWPCSCARSCTSPLQDGLAFLPALALAWALRFLWGYWLALLAFWATRADALLALQESLIFLLAGQVAPIALLPDLLQTAAVVLPFRYMVGFPGRGADRAVGRAPSCGPALPSRPAGCSSRWPCSWCMWRAGLRRYSAVGG